MSTPTLPGPNPDGEKKYVRVNVRGKKSSIWKKMRKEFVGKIKSLLATVLDPAHRSTGGSEVRALGAAAFDLVRAKLETPGLDNAHLESQIDSLYAQAANIRAQARKTDAEARKANAQAEALEIKNSFEKLKLLMEAAKLMAKMTGEEGDEMLSFVRDIDAFKEMVANVVLLAGPVANLSSWTGRQMGAFRDALCSAFDQDGLDQMLRFHLEKDREQLVGSGAFQTVVFKVIQVAKREGWLTALVQAARTANPGNSDLQRFDEESSGLVGKAE